MNKIIFLAITFLLVSVTAIQGASDCGYIVRDQSHYTQRYIDLLNSMGITVTLIESSKVGDYNLSNYDFFLVGNTFLSNAEELRGNPVNAYPTLFLSTYHADEFGWARRVSYIGNCQVGPAVQVKDGSHYISQGLPTIFQPYTQICPNNQVIYRYYLSESDQADGIHIIVNLKDGMSGFDGTNDAVVAAGNPGDTLTYYSWGTTVITNITAKNVWFGLPVIEHWAAPTEQLFRRSIEWLLIDDVPPKITVTNPTSGNYNHNSISLNISSDEELNQCWYQISGGVQTGFSPYSTTIDLADGVHVIAVYCNDTSGNIGNANVSITVDTVPPTLTLNSPRSNVLSDANFLLSVASDAVQCRYSINGQANLALPFNGGGWNQSIIGIEGNNTIFVICNDAALNNKTVFTSFIIDTVNPVVTIVQPQNKIYSSTSIPIEINALDTNLHLVSYKLLGINYSYGGITQKQVSDGTYTITAYAIDLAGHETTVSRQFSVDSTAPVINQVINEPLVPETGDPINIIAYVTDNNLNIVTLSYQVNNGVYQTMLMSVNGSHYIGAIGSYNAGDNISYSVIANDTLGNTATAPQSLIVQAPDTTPPSVQLVSPLNNSFFKGNTVLFSYTATDDRDLQICSLFINNNMRNSGFVFAGANNFSQYLMNANYSWQIRCNDTRGNIGLSDLYVVRVNGTGILSSFIFYPVADAAVDQQNPDVNYGSGELFTNPSTSYHQDSYLRWNFSGIPIIKLLDVTFYIYARSFSNSAERRVAVFEVENDSWIESQITWNHRPGYKQSIIDYFNASSANRWYNATVTSYIFSELFNNDPLMSILLRDNEPNTSTYEKRYASRESSGLFKPYLEVKFITPIPDHILISEVCYDPATSDFDSEFIELYNPTMFAVNLSNWTITISSGTLIQEIELPGNAIIPAHGYYLLADHDDSNSWPVSWDLPDYSAEEIIRLANTQGGIQLSNLTGVVDRFGYGNPIADYYETTEFPDILEGHSAERKPGYLFTWMGNGQDTDINLIDFIDRTLPDPHNSTAPTEPINDTFAPQIIDLNVSFNYSDATVNWTTNEPANGSFDWGTTTGLGNNQPLQALAEDHTNAVQPVSDNTTYYYQITVCDFFGNCQTTAILSFVSPDTDLDDDGILNNVDNCPDDANALQEDLDQDGVGDVCDNDVDGDTFNNSHDNCPLIFNHGQEDLDQDGIGNACENDSDGDGFNTSYDCNDLNAQIHPNASESCNGIDDDCDIFIDEAGSAGCIEYYADIDGDSFGKTENKQCLCVDFDPYNTTVNGDCDDTNVLVNPNQSESCNGIDDNCDSQVDELNSIGCTVYYADLDADGFGNSTNQCMCSADDPFNATLTNDCNDASALAYPAAVEICDGIDNDCDGIIDEEGSAGCTNYYYDSDADGFGSSLNKCLCAPEGQYNATVDSDCNDANSQINPSISESCNGMDDNCNALVDEDGAVGCSIFFEDADADGFGSSISRCLCTAMDNFTVSVDGDCNDTDGAVSPTSIESCNGIDDDCDGEIDENVVRTCGNNSCDGFQTCTAGSWNPCSTRGADCGTCCICENNNNPQEMFDATQNIDCDSFDLIGINSCLFNPDGNPSTLDTAPAFDSVCQSIGTCTQDVYNFSHSCNSSSCGAVCENDLDCAQTVCNAFDACYAGTYRDYQDMNNSCLGNCSCTENLCSSFIEIITDTDGDGYDTECDADCNDLNGSINPSVIELCNGIDDNCNYVIDEGFIDTDNDTLADCVDPDDDNDAINDSMDNCPLVINLGQEDFDFDGIGDVCDDDDDNDTILDISDNCPMTPNTDQLDLDSDGQGDACDSDSDGDGFNSTIDCNDSMSSVFPGATEICNSIDDNCNALIDEENSTGCIVFYEDFDNDSFGTSQNKCLCLGIPNYNTTKSGDCNDTNPAVNPGMNETCNSIDDNCNALIDEVNSLGCIVYHADLDLDGFGSSSNSQCLCQATTQYNLILDGDCNDFNATINPSAIETCNGIDDNCDGHVDVEDSYGCSLFFVDNDHDGYGINTSRCLCGAQSEYAATVIGDCNDQNLRQNPSMIEVCNSVDDNCNGLIDENGSVGCLIYYQDLDSDGFGTNANNCLCAPSQDYSVTLNGDCNDTATAINPSASESCNNIDDNCNGQIDEELFQSCGVGNCAGVSLCSFGVWSECSTRSSDCGICCSCSNTTNPVQEFNGQQDNDCDAYDVLMISSCNNNPDENPFTLDYSPAFDSVCFGINSCMQQSYSMEHSCNITLCGAECELDSDCTETECDQFDGCYAGTYRDYLDESNSCLSSCSCTSNICMSYNAVVTDKDGDGYDTECDADCDDSDKMIHPGSQELCNGLDDNCNLQVDEGFVDNDQDGLVDCVDPDDDDDGINDTNDNCIIVQNSGQEDIDNDGIGDVCDGDMDNDGVNDTIDICNGTVIGKLVNVDGCSCEQLSSYPLFDDGNNCSIGLCQAGVVNYINNDNYSKFVDCPADGCLDDQFVDWSVDGYSVCINLQLADYICTSSASYNSQCDSDDDGDGINDSIDNCPKIYNPGQEDPDQDGLGDVCDSDDDGDSINDSYDNCPMIPNPNQADSDQDGIGNACDVDRDQDGIVDSIDNCPDIYNPDQEDTDFDGLGDICDPDDDNDSINDTYDNCPLTANAGQEDSDNDGIGNVCDNLLCDSDGDGFNRYDVILCPNGNDCNDRDATIHPGAADPIDSYDQNCINDAPRIKPIADMTVQVDETVFVQPIVSDPEGDTITVEFNAPLDNFGRWTPTIRDLGINLLTVTASDGIASAIESFFVYVIQQFTTQLSISRLSIPDAKVAAGEAIKIGYTLENNGNRDLDGLRITVTVLDLGIKKTSASYSIKPGKRVDSKIYLEVPGNIPPGVYLLRFVVSNDDVRRVKHREITIT